MPHDVRVLGAVLPPLLWIACGTQHPSTASDPAPDPGPEPAAATSAGLADPPSPGEATQGRRAGDVPTGSSLLVGVTTREALVQAEPRLAPSHAPVPDADAVSTLSHVEPGAQVDVVLGTWCGDSRREVSRWFRAIDAMNAKPPFEMRYLAVDRSKSAPDGLLDGLDIRYVPTFIVRRAGREVGRVVESAPRGIEQEVAALLSGTASGTISGRSDLR